jgi:serine/threonine-protein kinase
VILYQMCTGKLPYDVLGTIIEALQNIQYAEPARPRRTTSRFDSDVEAIILKCLAKDPDQRYQSAAELKQEVGRWLDGLPIVAKSISSIYLLRKIVFRHRYATAVVALLFVIVCSFAYTSFYLYQRAAHAQEETETIARQWRREAEKQQAIAREAARFIAELMTRDAQRQREADMLLRPGPYRRRYDPALPLPSGTEGGGE